VHADTPETKATAFRIYILFVVEEIQILITTSYNLVTFHHKYTKSIINIKYFLCKKEINLKVMKIGLK
jgi:hypothetical protein